MGVTAEGFKRFLEQMDTSFTSGCWRQDTEACKRVGSTALGERTSSCRGPWTMPKSPRLATSPCPSGTCPGDRPKDKKKDTKFVPTCNPGETKAAVHPFRDVKSWFQCLGTMTGKQYS